MWTGFGRGEARSCGVTCLSSHGSAWLGCTHRNASLLAATNGARTACWEVSFFDWRVAFYWAVLRFKPCWNGMEWNVALMQEIRISFIAVIVTTHNIVSLPARYASVTILS